MLAKAFLPLAVVFILAACGGSKQGTSQPTIGVRGEGFTFEAPTGWSIARPRGAVVARGPGGLVSVTRFVLRKPYDPNQFGALAQTLDTVAARLAKAAGTSVAKSETTRIAGERVRAYTYGQRRIAFVLAGRAEYQLFCASSGRACDLLFSSFTLAA